MHLDICIQLGHSPTIKVTDASIIFKFPVSLWVFFVCDKNIECEIYPPNKFVNTLYSTVNYKHSVVQNISRSDSFFLFLFKNFLLKVQLIYNTLLIHLV